MLISTRYRSSEKEIMDDLAMEGPLLKKTLNQIAAINKMLGGNKATIEGLHALLKTNPQGGVISVVDLGCGNGDMLRLAAEYGRKKKVPMALTGIDANEYTINYARELSAGYPEINYRQMDITGPSFRLLNWDIVLATLFLHHFTNEEIESHLSSLLPNVKKGIVINDLHRNKTAYYLFKLVSLFLFNPMVKNDGAVSVLRGFKKNELIGFSKKLQGTTSSIRWKWAFRYRWIIKKI
jgi:2-polyprenyl-3-methyl-5-hydroxy-6-metoxy-1,4-benzoquinol methylase